MASFTPCSNIFLKLTGSSSFFPCQEFTELQLHVSYTSQRLLGGRAGVCREEVLKTCRLFSVFKPVLQEEGGEGAPSPPTPGLVYKKAWNETP